MKNFLLPTLYFLFLTAILSFAISPIALATSKVPVTPPQIERLPEAEFLPDVNMFRRSHPEKIIFSQIKLAGGEPDFDELAKASPFVHNAQEIDKSAMIFAEYNRIANNFSMHNETAPIVVKTRLAVDEYSSLQDMLVFDELDETAYFEFDYYGHSVGIVPEELSRFQHLALSKPSAERFFRITQNRRQVVAEFILIPSYADSKDPVLIGDKTYWLMAAKVAEFRLWNNDDPETAQLLWYHRAPWYSPKDDQQIDDLFNNTGP